jgi:nucleotide-binding universal stress UspA family protein
LMVYKRILVPLDGSTLGEAVLGCVAGVAKLNDAEVTLLTVIPPEGFPESEEFARVQHLPGPDALVRAYLEEKVAELQQIGVKASIAIRDGFSFEEILKYAEEQHVDLIAMSTHGRTGLTRVLLGSTADRVARTAKAPVMLVRSAEACAV